MKIPQVFTRYWTNLPTGLRLVLIYWLVTRLIFTILGTASIFLIGHYSDPAHQVVFQNRPVFSGWPFLDMWNQWDGNWYMHIAQHGYQGAPNLHHESDIVFFPLYPYLVRLLAWPFHFANSAVLVSGLLVSNICFITGAYYLYKLVAKKWGRRLAKLTILALFLSPMGFIFSATMTEGLFFMLLVLAFTWAEAGQWWRVGLTSTLLVLARPIGVFVAAVLGLMYWARLKFNWRQLWRPQSLWLVGPLIGAGILMLINHAIVHDYLGFLHAESAWHRRLLHIKGPSGGLFTLQGIYLTVFPLAALGLVAWAALTKRLAKIYLLLGVAMIALPFLTSSYGLIRYTASIFPLYIALSLLMDRFKSWYEPIIMTLLIIEGVHLVWWALGMPIMQ